MGNHSLKQQIIQSQRVLCHTEDSELKFTGNCLSWYSGNCSIVNPFKWIFSKSLCTLSSLTLTHIYVLDCFFSVNHKWPYNVGFKKSNIWSTLCGAASSAWATACTAWVSTPLQWRRLAFKMVQNNMAYLKRASVLKLELLSTKSSAGWALWRTRHLVISECTCHCHHLLKQLRQR